MEHINYYEDNQSVLEHLKKRETAVALEKARLLLERHPENALSHYSMGLCYYQKKDIFHAIECFTKALQIDPTFISAAEMLLKLNKDNYSLGELKYIYSLIIAYKGGNNEMYQFIQKFKTIPLNANLSVPKLGQDSLKTEELPGVNNNDYIQHLINEMDKPEKTDVTGSTPKKEISIIPESDFIPPPKKTAPSQNNKNDQTTQYGIETLTMAKLYTRQGLYDQAMSILVKLQQREPGSTLVKTEIERVKGLMQDKKESS